MLHCPFLRLFAFAPIYIWTLSAQYALSTPALAESRQVTEDTEGQVTRVFLVAGQSNAEGADTHASEIDQYPPFMGAGSPQPGAFVWYELGPSAYSSNGWIPMQPATQTKIFGPELAFARKVRAETGSRIAIIKSASGGTNLAVDWDPGNPNGQGMYERTLTLMQTALTDLTNSGANWELEGVIWQQGENDMLDSNFVLEYEARLAALIDNFRSDLGKPDLKFFVGETSFKCIWGLDYWNNMPILKQGQLAVAAADPLVIFVPSSHTSFKVSPSGPHYHFGTEGMLQLGEEHAEAYLDTIGLGDPHQSASFSAGLPAEVGDTVRVFVMTGQRSMEGEGAQVTEIQNQPSYQGLDELQQDVLYRYHLGGGAHVSSDWAPLGPADYLQSFGPELSFGQGAARFLDDPVAVIKIADSAAFLVDWLPGHPRSNRPQLDNAVQFIQQGLSDLSDAGFKPVLEGVIWLPAEHDAWWPPYRNPYATNLTAAVSNVRTALAEPNLKWFVAELRDDLVWGQTELDELDTKIASVAAADPNLWFVQTDSLTSASPAPTFGSLGALELGRLMARAYAATLP
ncbi:MAG: hypothetical protein ACI8X5_002823 [Planctomycetota bacterium]|jgi:hypothetical protein